MTSCSVAVGFLNEKVSYEEFTRILDKFDITNFRMNYNTMNLEIRTTKETYARILNDVYFLCGQYTVVIHNVTMEFRVRFFEVIEE